jgi:hypothetical protein
MALCVIIPILSCNTTPACYAKVPLQLSSVDSMPTRAAYLPPCNLLLGQRLPALIHANFELHYGEGNMGETRVYMFEFVLYDCKKQCTNVPESSYRVLSERAQCTLDYIEDVF